MDIESYTAATLSQARCYSIEDGVTIYCEIQDLQGVWSTGITLEDARRELKEVVEGWVELGLRLGHKLPVIDDVAVNRKLKCQRHEPRLDFH